MKKILLSLSIILLLATTSCEDFLDTENLTQKTNENFPNTESEANELLTGIYAKLLFEDPELESQVYLAQLASDECLGGNLSGSNNCATNFIRYTSNLDGYYGLWKRCYSIISRANNAITSLDNVAKWSSEKEKERHLGEVYFLRAFAYNELVQVFGGVPLRTTTEATNLPRATVDEIYELIGADLKKAIELLPAKSYIGEDPLVGHANKYTAEAMMARVFLFYTGRYAQSELPGGITKQMVIAWIDDCVDNSGHDLLSDQRNLWSYSNTATQDNTEGYQYDYVVNNNLKWAGNGNIETMFANKHKLKGNDWTYTWFSNKAALFFSPSADDYSADQSYPFGTGWGAGPVSPHMIEEWKKWSNNQTYINGATEDPRLTGSVWSYKALSPTGEVLFDRALSPDEPVYTVSKRYYEQTGYHQKKYINILSRYQGKFTSFGNQLYPGLAGVESQSLNNISDLVHIRFADVLLMQSELKEDEAGLNRVRARSNLAPVSYSLDAIKNERRWELAFESIRWWDLLRWSGPSLDLIGDALNKQNNFTIINAAKVVPMVQYDYKARIKATQGYWPIPQTEIDLSGGLLEQNPGWDASASFADWESM